MASDLSTTSASLWSSFLHNLGYNSGSSPNLAQSVATPKTQQSQLQQNQAFNDSLFGSFKRKLVNGKGVKSCSIYYKIAKGELPALPAAKGGGQLRLTHHTKGMCNPDCPLAADHVPYSALEYFQSHAWCEQNYPKGD